MAPEKQEALEEILNPEKGGVGMQGDRRGGAREEWKGLGGAERRWKRGDELMKEKMKETERVIKRRRSTGGVEEDVEESQSVSPKGGSAEEKEEGIRREVQWKRRDEKVLECPGKKMKRGGAER